MTQQTGNNPNPNAGASPHENGQAKEPDIDELLKEFDTAQPKPDGLARQTLETIAPVVDYVKRKKAEEEKSALDAELKSAVETVGSADELKDVPIRILRGWLEGFAAEDSAFSDAWKNRHQSPDNWQQNLARAQKALIEEMGNMPSNKYRNDVEAAAAAVRGSKATAPPEENERDLVNRLRNMSDTEFRRYKEAKAAET